MRKVEFSELKLKSIIDEEEFYKLYLDNLQSNFEHNDTFCVPNKQYEIIYLNILGGKIVLLNKDYIITTNIRGQELFFDYAIALKIYNCMLDINESIEDEKNEYNELYKEERLQKSEQIDILKKQDEEIFNKKQIEYNIIINSDIYKNYLELEKENEKLRFENKRLTEQVNNSLIVKKDKNSFLKNIINKLRSKNYNIGD